MHLQGNRHGPSQFAPPVGPQEPRKESQNKDQERERCHHVEFNPEKERDMVGPIIRQMRQAQCRHEEADD